MDFCCMKDEWLFLPPTSSEWIWMSNATTLLLEDTMTRKKLPHICANCFIGLECSKTFGNGFILTRHVNRSRFLDCCIPCRSPKLFGRKFQWISSLCCRLSVGNMWSWSSSTDYLSKRTSLHCRPRSLQSLWLTFLLRPWSIYMDFLV